MKDRLLGMLGLAVRAGKVSFGAFMTEKAVAEGKASLVIIAKDCGNSNLRKMENACRAGGVHYISYADKAALSGAVGKKDVPAVGVCDKNFAEAIVKIYGGVSK